MEQPDFKVASICDAGSAGCNRSPRSFLFLKFFKNKSRINKFKQINQQKLCLNEMLKKVIEVKGK